MDIGTLGGGIAALNAAKDLAQSLVGLRDAAKVQGIVVEMQSKMLSAQADQFAMLEKLRELESRLSAAEAWESEAARYVLKDFGDSTFAYALRSDRKNDEPDHSICSKCFAEQRKSILHFRWIADSGMQVWHCPACNGDVYLGSRKPKKSTSEYVSTRYF